jgi:hypothetical protein
MENEYDARLREFGEVYEDFEAEDVRDLILRAGERLAALCLDEDAVDAAMKCLHRALDLPDFATDHNGGRSWRALWKQTSSANLLDLPLAQRLTSLNAYAYFGLSPSYDGQPCEIEDVKNLIEAVKAALDADNVDRSMTAAIDLTLLAAQGRFALDEGKGVAPEQLAALVRIGQKSLRNALAPSSGSGLELKDGAVTAASALKWLSARGDFKPSIWRDFPTHAPEPARAIEGEILWVPFASGNTEFHPATCLRGAGYQIGPKGAERTVSDYRQALDQLARMRPAPYWRRPNTVGNWGIVTGVGFHPRTADELGLLSGQGGDK